MQELMQRQPPVTQGSDQVRLVLDAIEKAMGPQDITLTGVPETSHFARVLVAADYHMKRIAMDLEASPLESLPSFLDMMTNSRVRVTNMMPRWWLACNYQPLARSEDGLAWELRGPGVQAMTEDDFVARSGARTATGRKNPLAVRWAEAMTTNFTDLAARQPVFGQLRNLMDLCVIAAVVEREDLVRRAGCDLSLLTRSDSDLPVETWNPPKTVATQCSFTKRGREYLITASGGVRIDSWEVAEQAEVQSQVGDKRAAVAPAAAQQANWRWN
jgi:hypothetical protein